MATAMSGEIIVYISPPIILGTLYFFFARDRTLSRPMHAAFRTTLVVLILWPIYVLVSLFLRTDHFLFLEGFLFIVLFIPISFAIFVFFWSVITLFEYWTQSAYVDVEVTARGKTLAFIFLVIEVIIMLVLLLFE